MARFAYWTILVGEAPTSFRAREREDLVPTFRQLQRTQPTVRLCWFERGRVWASPDEAKAALRAEAPPDRERRGKDWRPGGRHEDPRAKYEIPRDVRRARFRARQHRPGEAPGDGRTRDFAASRPVGRPPAEGRAASGRPDGRPRTSKPASRPETRPAGDTRPWATPRPPHRPDARPPFRRDDRPARPTGASSTSEPRSKRPGVESRSGSDTRPPWSKPKGARPATSRPWTSSPTRPTSSRPPRDRSSDRKGRPPDKRGKR